MSDKTFLLQSTHDRSRLVQLILEHRPNVIVDSINTATAISYRDVFAVSVVAKNKKDALFDEFEGLTRTLLELNGTTAASITQKGYRIK